MTMLVERRTLTVSDTPSSRRKDTAGAGAHRNAPQPQSAVAPDNWWLGRLARIWPTFLGLFYLITGALFVHAHVLIGDAMSRISTARMVIAGVDPHLGGIGFVWGPLPAFLEIPLVALDPVAPWLVKDGYAGCILTAIFGAWAMWQLFQLLAERGISRAWCRGITAGVAFNPLFVIFAGNGMSEAFYLCFLLAAVRHLARFQRSGAASSLAAAGCYIGLDCLVRFESLAAALGALAFVAVVTWHRVGDIPWRQRARRASVDGLVFGFPVAFSFLFFIGISWWLTDTALAQYSSLYGQSAQITGTGISVSAAMRVPQVASELFFLSPAALLVVPFALYLCRRGRGSLFPVAAAVLGPALLFDIEGLSTGGIFNLIRYLILIIPLTALALTTVTGATTAIRRQLAAALGVVVIIASFVGTWAVLGNQTLAPQEYAYHQAVLGRPAEQYSDLQMGGADALTAWLDAQHTGRGSILIDIFNGFEVMAATKHPDRFVIPADENYQQVLDSPYQYGVRYLVVIPPASAGVLYTLNRYYPGLYQGCVAHTQLVLTVAGTGTPSQWRVYRLTAPITPSTLHTSGCPVHRVVIS